MEYDQLHVLDPATLPPGKTTIATKLDPGWVPSPSGRSGEDKFFSVGTRNLDSSDCGIVTTLNLLSVLIICKNSVY